MTLVSWPNTIFDPEHWDPEEYDHLGYTPHAEGVTPADQVSEFAGRQCYESWDRPNPATASNEGYVANILDHRHFSVVEHANFTVHIKGVSRSLTHELVRHRHFSYSQVSQRYVDESDFEAIIPPVIRDLPNATVRHALLSSMESKFAQARGTYKYIYEALRNEGVDKKAARGAARSVIPNAAETKVVVTGNMRAWLEFFDKRLSVGADQEIRDLSVVVLNTIRPYAPSILQEIKGWWPDESQ